jgi:hypothetical protein
LTRMRMSSRTARYKRSANTSREYIHSNAHAGRIFRCGAGSEDPAYVHCRFLICAR